MLDAGADRLYDAERYERTDARKETRAVHYTRNLDTAAGRVELKVPKLRKLPSKTAGIEHCKRREASIEESCLRCISPAFPSEGLKTLPKPSGGQRFHQVLSAI